MSAPDILRQFLARCMCACIRSKQCLVTEPGRRQSVRCFAEQNRVIQLQQVGNDRGVAFARIRDSPCCFHIAGHGDICHQFRAGMSRAA